MNGWCAEFAAAHPQAVHSAHLLLRAERRPPTSGPRWRAGARVFKVHVQVGGFDPSDPVLDAAWGLLAEAGVPVVVHCGSGPIPGTHTGPGPIGLVLRRHPELTAVIAHAGAPEYAEHLALAGRYRNVYLDTTMVGTGFLNRLAPIPAEALHAYRDLAATGSCWAATSRTSRTPTPTKFSR